MSAEMDRVLSAVLWPISLLLNLATSLPPLGVVLSTIVSILAIIHYVIQIFKNVKNKKEKDD